jgi:hypothetical protein
MNTAPTRLIFWMAVAGALLGSAPAMAQQGTGTPGATGAMSGIDGAYPNPATASVTWGCSLADLA